MKILIWGDPHIYPNSAFSRPTEDGLTTYLQEILKTGDWLNELVVEHRPHLSVCLGDVFHTHDHVDAQSLHVAELLLRNHLNLCAQIDAKFEMVLGNHEIYSPRIHLLPFMQDHVNGSVKARQFVNRKSPLRFEWLGFLPYGSDLSDLPTGKDNASIKIWFGHMEVKGAYRQAGSPSPKGMTLDQLPEGSILFNGHYHRPHAIAGPGGRQAVFPGSITARTFSDSGAPVPRGAILFDTVSQEIKRIENPHCQIFETVHVHSKEEIDKLQLLSNRDRTNVRVYLHDPGLEKDKRLRSQIAKFAHSAVVPAPIEVRGNQEAVLELDTAVDANLRRYLEGVELPEGLDLGRILESCQELVAEVGSVRQSKGKSIRFNNLAAENFMSFRQLYVDFTQPGLTLVEGQNLDDPGAASNGSGKSAIFEALYWALFDKTLRGTRKTEVGFLNGKKTGDPCSVRVDLEFREANGDYVVLRIHRYRNQPQKGTGLDIEIGDSNVTPRLPSDSQKVIDEILGIEPGIAQHLFFLTQGLSHRFMDLGDADRKRLVESIVGLDLYDAIHAAALKWKRDVEGGIQQKNNERISAHASASQAQSAVDFARQQLEFLESGNKTAISECDEKLESLQSHLDQENAKILGEKKNYDELHERSLILADELSDVVRRWEDAVSVRIRIETVLYQRKELAREAQALLKEGKCPQCGQSLDRAEHVHSQADPDLSSMESEYTAAKDIHRSLCEQKNALEAAQQSLKESMLYWSETITGTAGTIRNLESSIVQVQNAIKTAQSLRDERQRHLDEAEKRLAEAEAQLQNALNELQVENDKLSEKEFIVSIFAPTGIRSMVLRSVVDWLNHKLEEYSEILLGDDRVIIDSATELKSGKVVDKFNVAVHGNRSYTSCSSGERRRADLVIQFALNALARSTTGLHTNLLICDEIDDKLDMTGMENLAALLRKKAEDEELSVYLVTQHSFLKGLIPQRWVVRKENGVSSL